MRVTPPAAFNAAPTSCENTMARRIAIPALYPACLSAAMSLLSGCTSEAGTSARDDPEFADSDAASEPASVDAERPQHEQEELDASIDASQEAHSARDAGETDARRDGSRDASEPRPPDAASDAAHASTRVPCRAGSKLSAQDSDAGFAEYGSVFSSTRYVTDDASSHNPRALVIQVQANGSAVPGCEVSWQPGERSGWAFPSATLTDASGKLRVFWTAGDAPMPTLEARIAVQGEADQVVKFSGVATPSARTRTDSVHVDYDIPASYSELKVRVTPVTAPASTYYSTMNWSGAYAGIQFDGATTKVIFSVWDVDASHKSELVGQGACNQTVGFGGEGTGTSCRLVFPPKKNGAIAGLPDDYMLKAGDTYETQLVASYPADCATCTDYTVYFRDITRGLGPISLGTQRYKKKVTLASASAFIEDWSDQPGDDCISALARTAYLHDIEVKSASGVQRVSAASFHPVYRPDNHEICANYYFGAKDGRFLVSSGGDALVSRPLISADPVFGQAIKASL
jgi:hypothetical protein